MSVLALWSGFLGARALNTRLSTAKGRRILAANAARQS